VKSKYAIIIGILIGLGIFINTSGIIIGGILFLLLIKELGIKKKAIPLILAAAIAVAVFSGFELKSIFTFVFNKNLISIQNMKGTFNSGELSGYKIADATTKTATANKSSVSKLDILLKGKLQGLTQIQFYGFIFIIFLITLFRTVKSHALDNVSKNVLLYIGLFFFIIMDPFFLNPQKYAYVLSISPKYTVLLTIFAAFFIAHHFDDLTKIQDRKYYRSIFLVSSYLLFFISIASLISPLRNIFVKMLYFFISKIIPIYNNTNYYTNFLNNLILLFSLSYIVIFLTFYILKKFNKIEKISLTSMTSTIIVVFLFILPDLFLLNSNYGIYGTLTHAFCPNNAEKVAAATNSPSEKQLFTIINYINTHVGNNKNIYIAFEQSKGTSYNNAWYFTNNNRRLVMDSASSRNNLDSIDYLLASKNSVPEFALPENKSATMQTADFIIYKLH
jgi:hypothetical protein